MISVWRILLFLGGALYGLGSDTPQTSSCKEGIIIAEDSEEAQGSNSLKLVCQEPRLVGAFGSGAAWHCLSDFHPAFGFLIPRAFKFSSNPSLPQTLN